MKVIGLPVYEKKIFKDLVSFTLFWGPQGDHALFVRKLEAAYYRNASC